MEKEKDRKKGRENRGGIFIITSGIGILSGFEGKQICLVFLFFPLLLGDHPKIDHGRQRTHQQEAQPRVRRRQRFHGWRGGGRQAAGRNDGQREHQTGAEETDGHSQTGSGS